MKRFLLFVMVLTTTMIFLGCDDSDNPTGTIDDNTPSENTNGDNSPDNNSGDDPPDNGGGGDTPPDNGGDTPPDNGGDTPPDNGGGDDPPDNGGGDTPPDNGDGDNPPDDGGDNPPDNNANRAPNAYAGDDDTVAVEDTVTVDGSGSSDRDGDTLTYDWQFTSRPEGSNAALSNKAAVNPSFVADKEGQYIVELKVSDGKATATDSVIITASPGQTTSDCSEVVPGQSIADDFVCAHNDVRANAQPTPSPPLAEVTWDPALAQIAQDYAQICKWGHNDNRGDTYPGYVGENIYASYGQTTTPAHAVESWADEAQYYDYNTNSCQENKVCGHYTQIVWRDSVKIGCAQVTCPTLTGLGWRNAEYIVCNYAPGGNYQDEKPY